MDVIIIGAGASGLMAAITAANQGAKVTVIEHENKPGKKILVTGNGKCNITNTKMNEECFYGNKNFLSLYFTELTLLFVLIFTPRFSAVILKISRTVAACSPAG